MKDNLRFAFTSFMKIHGSSDTLSDDEGWTDFLAAIAVRDRITHPKRTEDLEIGDHEIVKVRMAATWLVLHVVMSVAKTMGSTALWLLTAFVIGWGLLTVSSSSQLVPLQARETD